jgi:hypothetical protein
MVVVPPGEKYKVIPQPWPYISNLTKDAPLRNAALTLSAFHQHNLSPYHSENQENELLQYHTKALQELRHVVGHQDLGAFSDRSEEWLKFLAGGMFLISFEVRVKVKNALSLTNLDSGFQGRY